MNRPSDAPLSTYGSAGDVFPMVGLTLVLRARGGEPVAITSGIGFDAARAGGSGS